MSDDKEPKDNQDQATEANQTEQHEQNVQDTFQQARAKIENMPKDQLEQAHAAGQTIKDAGGESANTSELQEEGDNSSEGDGHLEVHGRTPGRDKDQPSRGR